MKNSHVRLEHMELMGKFFAGFDLDKVMDKKELQFMVICLRGRG